ncbi:hypothetical protein C8Q74DRAFT_1439392 [Fomes fomentarius]|nr:hypothetical protein C8Q74DRAFT_1439392 [Fomes fomentarius]
MAKLSRIQPACHQGISGDSHRDRTWSPARFARHVRHALVREPPRTSTSRPSLVFGGWVFTSSPLTECSSSTWSNASYHREYPKQDAVFREMNVRFEYRLDMTFHLTWIGDVVYLDVLGQPLTILGAHEAAMDLLEKGLRATLIGKLCYCGHTSANIVFSFTHSHSTMQPRLGTNPTPLWTVAAAAASAEFFHPTVIVDYQPSGSQRREMVDMMDLGYFSL